MPPKKVARKEGGTGDGEERSDATPHSLSSTGSLSLNPIFACTAPRAGLLSLAGSQEILDELLDVVDDAVYQAVNDAWEAVRVPAADYWCARPQQALTITSHSFISGPTEVQKALVPNPRSLPSSFYSTRLAALRGRGYATNGGLVVVGVDRRVGNGSKLFNALPRHGLADFTAAIPRPHDRNMYVLIDEQAAIDPYFDIDCSYALPDGRASAGAAVAAFHEAFPWRAREAVPAPVDGPEIETILHTILAFLQWYLENQLNTKVEQCLVLTSSLQTVVAAADPVGRKELQELKLSFHVHFRLHDQHVFASVREMHMLMSQLRERLDGLLQTEPSAEDDAFFQGTAVDRAALLEAAKVVRRCVDFGVYSRWRAFRLPYNVKTPFNLAAGDATGFTPADAAVDDLLTAQLAQSGVVVNGLPDVAPGAAASTLVQTVELCADPSARAAQVALLKKMQYQLRFLVPVVAGVTSLQHVPLKSFLEQYAPQLPEVPTPQVDNRRRFALAVMDLATIQRDATAPHAPVAAEGVATEAAERASAPGTRALADGGLVLLHFRGTGLAAAKPSAPQDAEQGINGARATGDRTSPFTEAMPSLPNSPRVMVTDTTTKELLAEVFACLAPQYAGVDPAAERRGANEPMAAHGGAFDFAPFNTLASRRITADHITAQYEESIRGYYVMQKQSKYCLRQGRTHKSTYGQLYLTYGSIKVRCYANDCCERCLYIPWTQPSVPVKDVHTVSGYPKYDRLAGIRSRLFAELPLDELVRRYGPEVLDRMRRQQQEEQQQTAAQPQSQQLTEAAV